MAHTPPHRSLSSLLLGVATPLLIWRKFDELVMITKYFYKSLHINTVKNWELLMDPNKMNPNPPQMAQKTLWALPCVLSATPFWARERASNPTLTREFFWDSMRFPQYFIIFQYILFWVEYNSKYHKYEITLRPLFLKKDSWAINTPWILPAKCS
jgi:hypothetical protein